jgi:uncharacterized RDD family membrane protein YckC
MTAIPKARNEKRRTVYVTEVYRYYAGFVSRTLAMIIDLILLSIGLLLFGIGFDFLRRTSGIAQLVTFLRNDVPATVPLLDFFISPTFQLLFTFGSGFLYLTFFYGVVGTTIGKHLLGLRVVNSMGKSPDIRQIVVRVLAYAVSALPLYLGFLAILNDERRRGWHDRISGTYVVHGWDAQGDETFLRGAIERLKRP